MVRAQDSFTVENILAVILLILLVPMYFIIERFCNENYKDIKAQLKQDIENDKEKQNDKQDKERTKRRN